MSWDQFLYLTISSRLKTNEAFRATCQILHESIAERNIWRGSTLTMLGLKRVLPSLNPRRSSCNTVPLGTSSFSSLNMASWNSGSKGCPAPGTASTPSPLKVSTICLYKPCQNTSSTIYETSASLLLQTHQNLPIKLHWVCILSESGSKVHLCTSYSSYEQVSSYFGSGCLNLTNLLICERIHSLWQACN